MSLTAEAFYRGGPEVFSISDWSDSFISLSCNWDWVSRPINALCSFIRSDYIRVRGVCSTDSVEMAEKVIEWDNDMCKHMHRILRWLKIRTIFRSNSIFLWILNHLRVFETKKARDKYFVKKLKEKWMIRIWAISKSDVYVYTCLLQWLFEPSQHSSCVKLYFRCWHPMLQYNNQTQRFQNINSQNFHFKLHCIVQIVLYS